MDRLELVGHLVNLSDMSNTAPATTIAQTGDYAEAVRYIDMAHASLQAEHFDFKYKWIDGSFVTIATTQDYAGPSSPAIQTWAKNRFFYNNEPLPCIEWEDYVPDTSLENGEPDCVVILPNNKIRLVPTPNDVYSIAAEGWRENLIFTADADEPLFHEDFHWLIVARALIMYGNFESAPECKAQGEEIYNELYPKYEQKYLARREQMDGRSEAQDFQVRCE